MSFDMKKNLNHGKVSYEKNLLLCSSLRYMTIAKFKIPKHQIMW